MGPLSHPSTTSDVNFLSITSRKEAGVAEELGENVKKKTPLSRSLSPHPPLQFISSTSNFRHKRDEHQVSSSSQEGEREVISLDVSRHSTSLAVVLHCLPLSLSFSRRLA
jgi:hypothetical protein